MEVEPSSKVLLKSQGNLLLGYSFVSGDKSLTLMSGIGVQGSHFTAHRVRNVTLDWASSAELDTKPTQSTTLNAQASYSTALNEYYSQLDMGYAIAKDLYAGPLLEMTVLSKGVSVANFLALSSGRQSWVSMLATWKIWERRSTKIRPSGQT